MFGDFEQYLRRKAFIQEKYVPYYLKWVSYCYLFLDQPETYILASDQLQSYLNHIAKTREDWQVKQYPGCSDCRRHYLLGCSLR